MSSIKEVFNNSAKEGFKWGALGAAFAWIVALLRVNLPNLLSNAIAIAQPVAVPLALGGAIFGLVTSVLK